MYKHICFIVILLVGRLEGYAQRDEQLWLDFQVDYPFANKFLFEIAPSYQTVFSEEKWRSLSLSTSFEYTMFTYLDLTFELPFAYTLQKEGYNSFELAPLLGTRFYITQNRRIDTRLLLRYQQRYFKHVEEDDWDISNRTRIKGEAYICINRPNLFTNNLWYLILDYEEFIVLDKQLEERFANRRRARVGVGYRLSYKNRFEFIYTRQTSRNEIDEEFLGTDNVFQLRYKLYLNPSKIITDD